MSLKKYIIIIFCLIEIVLMSPRTFSYILIDLLPIRIIGLPLITFSFLVTVTGYIFTELLANKIILARLTNFRIVIIIWVGIIMVSALKNPLRDIIFESQGIIIFMMNIVMFSVASVYLKSKRERLIFGIFLSIAATIFILNCILLTNPTLLPKGYSQDDLRFEGLYSSTPIMALVTISTAYCTIYNNITIKFIGLMGILISLSGLIMTATRGPLGASIIASAIVIAYSMKIQLRATKSLAKLLIILSLISFGIIKLSSSAFPLGSNVEYYISRVSMLEETHYDQSRLDEAYQDIRLFIESPLFGHGYGLLNIYTVEGWDLPLFSHNFLTSILSRTGLFGFIIISWYGFSIYKKTHIPENTTLTSVFVISRASLLSALFLIIISNFSGFQTFGIYGALAGIACGANIDQESHKIKENPV